MRQEFWEARWQDISKFNGLPVEEAAAVLGVSRQTVATYRKRFGYEAPAPDLGPLQELAAQGFTVQEAADKLGMAKTTLWRHSREYGIQFRHGSAKLFDERSESMVAMYRAGRTLEDIGAVYSITRERVRQIIKKYHGLTGKDGGQRLRATQKKTSALLRREARCMQEKGCTLAQYKELKALSRANFSAGMTRDRTPIGAFTSQKRNAASRGIEWSLKLWDWWLIWADSGKWEQRGRKAGEYVMCRYMDNGGYALGNVYVATVEHNLKVQPNNRNRKGHPDYKAPVAKPRNAPIQRFCSVGGCEIKHYGIGLCRRHYDSARYRERSSFAATEVNPSRPAPSTDMAVAS